MMCPDALLVLSNPGSNRGGGGNGSSRSSGLIDTVLQYGRYAWMDGWIHVCLDEWMDEALVDGYLVSYYPSHVFFLSYFF